MWSVKGVLWDAADWPKSTKALLGPWSVTVLTGEAHAKLRRVLNPAFRSSVLARSIPAIANFAYEYCNRWADEGLISGYSACKGFPFKVILISFIPDDFPLRAFL